MSVWLIAAVLFLICPILSGLMYTVEAGKLKEATEQQRQILSDDLLEKSFEEGEKLGRITYEAYCGIVRSIRSFHFIQGAYGQIFNLACSILCIIGHLVFWK